MSKSRSVYICQQCASQHPRWLGKCPNCGAWGGLVESVINEVKNKSGNQRALGQIKSTSLTKVSVSGLKRTPTKSMELDRVLGGGIVKGQVILIAGEPGIGKSTLLTQLANKLGQANSPVIYASGEESAFQIAHRAHRLAIKNKNIEVLEETNIDSIVEFVRSLGTKKPQALIIDSIQTMTTDDLSGLAGSVGQVRECTFRLVKLAKSEGIIVFLVGHVTKEGTVAGPSVLTHIVDSVLWFEGEKTLQLRLIRAVKNRFGPTDEVGIFEMTDKGLTSLTNADKIFLSTGTKQVSGSLVASVMQGTRPLLIEIQSLVTPAKSAFPRRIAQGIDPRRLELLIAIIIKRLNLPLYDYDVFVNIAGGIKVTETASDLATCLSIISSYLDKPLVRGAIAVGEVGLLGEIREVSLQEKRIREAKRLGFNSPITSKEVKYLNQAVKKYM